MLDLLLDYVDVAMTKNSPTHGKVEELEKYYQDVVPVCVDYCLALDMTWVHPLATVYSKWKRQKMDKVIAFAKLCL